MVVASEVVLLVAAEEVASAVAVTVAELAAAEVPPPSPPPPSLSLCSCFLLSVLRAPPSAVEKASRYPDRTFRLTVWDPSW